MRKDRDDQAVSIALVLLAAALIERCEIFLARVSTTETVLEEIEAFRQAALQHVSVKPAVALAPDFQAKAVGLACDHVNGICDSWLESDTR